MAPNSAPSTLEDPNQAPVQEPTTERKEGFLTKFKKAFHSAGQHQTGNTLPFSITADGMVNDVPSVNKLDDPIDAPLSAPDSAPATPVAAVASPEAALVPAEVAPVAPVAASAPIAPVAPVGPVGPDKPL